MKHLWWLIGILTAFAAIGLIFVSFFASDPRALNGLSTVAALLSFPVAGLISIFLFQASRQSPPNHGPSTADRFPIFVIGNGSNDVRVEADTKCVRVFVGGPANVNGPAPALPGSPRSLPAE
jgi:hypothetical protein